MRAIDPEARPAPSLLEDGESAHVKSHRRLVPVVSMPFGSYGEGKARTLTASPAEKRNASLSRWFRERPKH